MEQTIVLTEKELFHMLRIPFTPPTVLADIFRSYTDPTFLEHKTVLLGLATHSLAPKSTLEGVISRAQEELKKPQDFENRGKWDLILRAATQTYKNQNISAAKQSSGTE